MSPKSVDLVRQAAREEMAQKTIAFHKERGEGSATYHCGRYLGVMRLHVVQDGWNVEWSEEPEDSLADY